MSEKYKIKNKRKNLFISFSGGESSAFMLLWIMSNIAHLYDEIVVIFANTGQENEETLIFVKRIEEHFCINVIWVESVVHPLLGDGTTHNVVDFETANRDGRIFEDVIKKYGIPNASYLHCTRELKTQAMYHYIKTIGWKNGDYNVAIGIRGDEIDRMDANYLEKGFIYPLIGMVPSTKPHINEFWAKQPFRLNLKGYQGNCKWCWKKTLRKHITIYRENPSFYDFPERMEKEHGLAGRNIDGTKRVFMRKHLSIDDFKIIATDSNIATADDDADVYPEPDLFGFELDVSQGCIESCEVDFDGYVEETHE